MIDWAPFKSVRGLPTSTVVGGSTYVGGLPTSTVVGGLPTTAYYGAPAMTEVDKVNALGQVAKQGSLYYLTLFDSNIL